MITDFMASHNFMFSSSFGSKYLLNFWFLSNFKLYLFSKYVKSFQRFFCYWFLIPFHCSQRTYFVGLEFLWRHVLWIGLPWSMLHVHLKSICIWQLLGSVLHVPIRTSWVLELFNMPISLLIACLFLLLLSKCWKP